MSAMMPLHQETEDELRRIWKNAISAFEESSKTKLTDRKLVEMLGNSASMHDIETTLAAYGTDLKNFRKKGQSVRRAFKPFLEVLRAIAEPVGELLSLVGVPGGKVIFLAVANLLKAIDGVSQVYDNLTDVLEQIQDVFSRLQILSDADAITPALGKLYVQTLSQVLVILGSYIRYSNVVRLESRWLTRLKVWSTRSRDLMTSAAKDMDIQNAIAKLEKLGNRIQQTTTTETMVSTTKNLRNGEMLKEEQEKRRERAWLAAPDPNKNQEERRKQGSTVRDHGQWLLDLPQFQKWLVDPVGLFWVSASAGVGKSVLFSRVVDYLKQKQSTSPAALAFFYFDYRDEAKQNYQKFLASIVQSFGETSMSCRELLRSSQKAAPNASESELENLLQSMLKTPGVKFLAIDAVDECWERERVRSLLPFLQNLARDRPSRAGSLHIFITSRPEPDIEEALWGSDGTERVATDRLRLGERKEHLIALKTFIHAELQTQQFKGLGWSERFIREVEDELLNKSDSMFLWVQLQLEQLNKCSENDARRALPKLPRTLKETYARILGTVDENRQITVRVVLECIISATRPLSEREIGDIFLFDLDLIYQQPSCLTLGHNNPDSLDETSKDLRNTMNIFKLLPSSLIRRGAHDEISFIHFTVQEYLLSNPTSSIPNAESQASNGALAAFGTSREKAHATALIVSLSALDNDNRKKLQSIGKYSDESWFIHARSAMPEYSSIAPALAHFLYPKSNSFTNWAIRRYPTLLKPFTWPYHWSEPVHRDEIKPVGQDQPIHWAVRIGSPSDLKRLLSLDAENEDLGTDIRNAHDTIGWTPLCYAASIGDTTILDILLEGNESWMVQRVGPKFENLTIIHLLLPKLRWNDSPGITENALGSGGFTDSFIDLIIWPASHDWSGTPNCVKGLRKLLTAAPDPKGLLATRDSARQSPLRQVLRRGKCQSIQEIEIVGMLLGFGAPRERSIARFLTYYACYHSDASFITKFADDYGIDMNTGAPLRLAVLKETVECVQALLDLNVSTNLCDKDGKGPLDHALEYHGSEWDFDTDRAYKRAIRDHKPSANQQLIYDLLKQHGAELHQVSGDSRISDSDSEPDAASGLGS
ncbi:hypothetical protein DL93DRAFT_357571 [Clavulina sp. PMI_390]|nr:hypothetical protein DL93DRAFT_357571 [Clavulina sp. PMI_390]